MPIRGGSEVALDDEALVDAAVSAIYATIERADAWPEALERIVAATHSEGVLLNLHRMESATVLLFSSALKDGVPVYMRDWASRDIRAQRVIERNLAFTQDTIADEDILTEEEMDTDPFYAEFLASQGLRYFCAATLAPRPGFIAALTVQRTPKQGPFDAKMRARIGRFGRHVETALRYYANVISARERQLLLQEVLERHGDAVFLLEPTGEVAYRNGVARSSLPQLTSSSAGLRFHDPRAAERLERALEAFRAGRLDMASAPIFLPAVGDGPALAVTVFPGPPVRRLTLESGEVEKRHLVVVASPVGKARPLDPAVVRDFLGVTLGEARIAALVARGFSAPEIAAELQISEGTVRYTLSQVFAKTGVKRQSELAAVLNTLSAVPRLGG